MFLLCTCWGTVFQYDVLIPVTQIILCHCKSHKKLPVGILLLTMANLLEIKCTHIIVMSLALAAIKLGVSGVPYLHMFSSLLHLSSCVMRQIQFGQCVHESAVGDVVSGRGMPHI